MKYLRVILIVLLLVCCSLWVASSLWKITWISSDGRLSLHIYSGESAIIWRFETDETPRSGLIVHKYHPPSWHWWPAVWIGPDHPQIWAFTVTFWLPTLLLALPLAISASPWARRRRRAKQGLCIRCGYDLSGTDHNLCSECGTKREPLETQPENAP